MKKVYKVDVVKCDPYEGKQIYYETEYVTTDNIDAYIETKKTEIESHNFWWMEHCKELKDGKFGRPRIIATEIVIKKV